MSEARALASGTTRAFRFRLLRLPVLTPSKSADTFSIQNYQDISYDRFLSPRPYWKVYLSIFVALVVFV